jgi:23S rRNA (guanosine2251-2'-O)-methyltransferase
MQGGRGSGPCIARRRCALWGRHAVEAALNNPARSHRKLWATREGIASLDGELAGRLSRSSTPRSPISRGSSRATPRTRGSCSNACRSTTAPADVLDGDPARPVVVLDQVTDPHNVGAILRSAAAFDAAALVTQDRHAPPEGGVVAKSASGALEVVPWIRVVNLARALEELAEAGYWRLGLAGEATRRWPKLSRRARGAGASAPKAKGLRHNIAAHCDALARLPISDAMESLNVSNAAAIALYAVAARG